MFIASAAQGEAGARLKMRFSDMHVDAPRARLRYYAMFRAARMQFYCSRHTSGCCCPDAGCWRRWLLLPARGSVTLRRHDKSMVLQYTASAIAPRHSAGAIDAMPPRYAACAAMRNAVLMERVVITTSRSCSAVFMP